MTVCISTSSPVSSVSLLSEHGQVRWSGSLEAPGRSGEVCIGLLDEGLTEIGARLEDVKLFVADVGPGGFTAVRVGITLCKTFAWNFSVGCAGRDAFNLISPDDAVAIPAGKQEWLLRVPGDEPRRVREIPVGTVGYGIPGACLYPSAFRLASFADQLRVVAPHELAPLYMAEPSISLPKRPLSRVGT